MNSSFSNIFTITKRELAGFFTSPIAYVFIIILLMLSGFFTFMLGRFFENDEASLLSFFMWHPWLYLFLVPAVGMRLWSEERRSGTIELLLTMPISVWQAIVGKFLASWLFLALALFLTFPMVITVNDLGDPDNGRILTGYFGSFLMAGAYLAVTSVTSALTRNQVVSFIISVVVCLFMIMAGFYPVVSMLQFFPVWLVDAVSSFSVMTHYDGFQKGLVDSRDLIYFLSVIGFSLFATAVVLRSKRS